MSPQSPSVVKWKDVALNNTRRLSHAAERLATEATLIARVGVEVAGRLGRGGVLLFCGNGGSAATAQHFSAEFTGKLSLDRRPWPAVSLTTDTSALTAIGNDYGFDEVFARQVRALAGPDDVLIGLSTSGTSVNVLRAVAAAREVGALTVLLTGPRVVDAADFQIRVGVGETARIQEVHELILHAMSAIIERELDPTLGDDRATDRWPFVLGEEHVAGFRGWLRESGQVLVSTNGVFDLLHAGHRASLLQAASFGDRLVVLVNDDASVHALKGPARPVRSLAERVDDLRWLPMVDHVMVMPDRDPVRLLGLLEPDVHCKGEEYRDRAMPEADVVQAGGGRVEFLQRVEGFSTTGQIARINQGKETAR